MRLDRGSLVVLLELMQGYSCACIVVSIDMDGNEKRPGKILETAAVEPEGVHETSLHPLLLLLAWAEARDVVAQ